MNQYLNGDYDTVTLGEWKGRDAQAPVALGVVPIGGSSPAVGRRDEGQGTAELQRSCELCGAHIAANADRRRRFCSASCRAKAAKRRNPKLALASLGGGQAVTPEAAGTGPGMPISGAGDSPGASPGEGGMSENDLEMLGRVAASLLQRPEVSEVEFRVLHYPVIVRG